MSIDFLHSESTGIKICGLIDEEMVDVAVGSGAGAIGFVFVEDSPRYIERTVADTLMLQLPDEVTGVAVVQNATSLDSFSTWNGLLQLCGDEDERTVATAPRPVIKAVQWDPEEVLRWDGCENVKAILVDGSRGGLGVSFDVTALAKIIPSLQTPIIIAGGLTSQNVQEVIRIAQPAAVDVSSGIESRLGIKDPKLICEFINNVVALG
jgi:phosphoribosylanthranilate isomerase